MPKFCSGDDGTAGHLSPNYPGLPGLGPPVLFPRGRGWLGDDPGHQPFSLFPSRWAFSRELGLSPSPPPRKKSSQDLQKLRRCLKGRSEGIAAGNRALPRPPRLSTDEKVVVRLKKKTRFGRAGDVSGAPESNCSYAATRASSSSVGRRRLLPIR